MPVVTDDGEELFPVTAEAYFDMAAAGAFTENDRVELLEGAIVAMSPEGRRHSFVLADVLAWVIRNVDLERLIVPTNASLVMGAISVPQPDVMVFDRAVYEGGDLPTGAYLVIEVSHTSLRKDLRRKARIYAQGGIAEYWVVDVERAAVHVHQDPRDDAYDSVTIVRPPANLTPQHVGLPPLDLAKLFAEG